MPDDSQNGSPEVSTTEERDDIDREALFQELSDSLNADLFVFSGPIERPQASMFIDVVERVRRRENVGLVICTYGGDADAAYIIARFLKNNYKTFTLYVFGYCKSAGTLIALGADEIVMSSRGELGPLDVQLLKTDELVFRGSGLDVGQAISSLSDQSFEIFEKHFLEIIKRGGGAITTKTAAEIASSLAVSLVSPITDQIDPLRVGEVERAIKIAYEYGNRLSSNPEKVNSLIRDYPSHSFVIDYEEAKGLFGNVRRPKDAEIRLEQVLQDLQDEEGRKCIRDPHRAGLVGCLKPQKEVKNEPEEEPDRNVRRVPASSAKRSSLSPVESNGNNQAGRKSTPKRGSKKRQPAEKAKSSIAENGRQQ